MKRHFASSELCNLPKIVDTMAVIGVIMGNDDPIDVGPAGCKQLLAEIRSAVDQQRLAAAFDQDRRAGSTVPRLIGIAVAPIVADPRNTG